MVRETIPDAYKKVSNAITEITLAAIINYICEHVKTSTEIWSFNGLDSDGFNANALLELIYYVNPSIFNEVKAYAESNAEEDEHCNIQ